MSIERFFIHELTVVHPRTTTGRGADTVADWSSTTRTPARGWVAQTSSNDSRPDRGGDVTEWLLQTSASVDLRPGDRVEWQDFTFDVVGRPVPAWTPRGEHHVEARLRLVEG